MRIIYNLFKARFQDYVIQDFLLEIPDSVKEPAISVIKEHAVKIEKLMLFMASELHRRMLADNKNSEIYRGMLMQVKIIHSLIGTVPTPVLLSQTAPPEAKRDYIKDALDGVTKFLSPTEKTPEA